MKNEFNEYLIEIGLTGAILARADEIFKYYTVYLNYEVDEIFVSEYIGADGSRIYESLWFFNKKYCFEAKQFIIVDDFDTDFYEKEIFSFNATKKEYNINENIITDNSRFNLSFSFNPGRVGILKASKINCKQLSKILKVFIQPNLKA